MSRFSIIAHNKIEVVEKREKEAGAGTGRGGEEGREAGIEVTEDGDGTQRAQSGQIVA